MCTKMITHLIRWSDDIIVIYGKGVGLIYLAARWSSPALIAASPPLACSITFIDHQLLIIISIRISFTVAVSVVCRCSITFGSIKHLNKMVLGQTTTSQGVEDVFAMSNAGCYFYDTSPGQATRAAHLSNVSNKSHADVWLPPSYSAGIHLRDVLLLKKGTFQEPPPQKKKKKNNNNGLKVTLDSIRN